MFFDPNLKPSDIVAAIKDILALADDIGLVITVSQKPLEPLAMGHYVTVVEAREKQRAAANVKPSGSGIK